MTLEDRIPHTTQYEARFSEKYPNLAKAFGIAQQRQLNLFAQKMLDYGIDNIKAGTNLETEEDLRFALTGIWFRMMDKMNRWKNLGFDSSKKPNNESLVDTFEDLANYALIAKLVASGDWHK